jgi:hypothetical protein
MATLKEATELTSELTELTQELHSELTDGEVDFDRIIDLADRISEQADGLATAFTTVNEALAERIDEVKKGGSSGGGNGGAQSRKKDDEAGGRKGGSKSRKKSGS